ASSWATLNLNSSTSFISNRQTAFDEKEFPLFGQKPHVGAPTQLNTYNGTAPTARVAEIPDALAACIPLVDEHTGTPNAFALPTVPGQVILVDVEHARYAQDILAGFAQSPQTIPAPALPLEGNAKPVVLFVSDGRGSWRVTVEPEHARYVPEILEGFAELARHAKRQRNALANPKAIQPNALELIQRPASPQQSASLSPVLQPRRKSTRSILELPPSNAFIELFKTICKTNTCFEALRQLVRKAARGGLLKKGERQYLLSRIDVLQSTRLAEIAGGVTLYARPQEPSQLDASTNGTRNNNKRRNGRKKLVEPLPPRDGFAKTIPAPRKGEPIALASQTVPVYSIVPRHSVFGSLAGVTPAITHFRTTRQVVKR
ncbi:hypothetical protein HY992_05200, partial [Candidatus Micrarchaeota archaeon]|nr:hypothetical protein [Candidatus Micrarchaeota archaeon]